MFKKHTKDSQVEESLLEKPSLTATSPFTGYESFRNKNMQEALFEKGTEKPEIFIGENVKIEGSLTFETLAKIEGHFTGEIISKGKIIIGPQGIVKADIFLEEAVISGRVEGNITVTKKLILEGSAKITGDITAPSISVGEGVSICGKLHVTKTPSPEELEEDFPLEEDPL
ncbi:MAG: polymer-forming cytoskeletal protein [Chlamydiae bacterium]|nr:polymer-forming cytoskeletal protein [Chlamydiota bacterium]